MASVQSAVLKGRRALLKALRDTISTAIDDGVPARDLASLARRLLEISAELDGVGAAKDGDGIADRMLMYPDAVDEMGREIKIGQFPQVSMQPHSDQMRMWAEMFAAETQLPVGALGIVQDNPSSAEAIFASKEDLIIEAERTATAFGAAWRRALLTGVQLVEGLRQAPPELAGLAIRWHDPSFTPMPPAGKPAVFSCPPTGFVGSHHHPERGRM